MKLHIPPALRHRRFRLLWIGLLISIAGSRMQFWTLLWHIRQLSDQPIALGGIGLARILPMIFFSLIGGAAADSFDRRRVQLVSQAILVGLASTLGVLTLSGQITIWHIYLITALQATTVAFDLPARQSLTPNLVPAEDLPNAFSLQSISFTVGAIIGPASSGLVIAGSGLEYVYFLNAISYLAIVVAVLRIGDVPQEIDAEQPAGITRSAILEGVRFVWKQPLILSSMILDFIATFFSSARALLPIFTIDILGLGEVAYGLLSAAEAVGSAVTALVISQFGELRRQGATLLWAVVIYGLATVLFGFSRSFILSLFALALIGAGDTVSTIIRNTIRQLQTPDRLRGRMTSINQVFFMGGPQLGELEAGLAAQFFGAPFAVISGGIACILSVGWVARRWPQLAIYNDHTIQETSAATTL